MSGVSMTIQQVIEMADARLENEEQVLEFENDLYAWSGKKYYIHIEVSQTEDDGSEPLRRGFRVVG